MEEGKSQIASNETERNKRLPVSRTAVIAAPPFANGSLLKRWNPSSGVEQDIDQKERDPPKSAMGYAYAYATREGSGPDASWSEGQCGVRPRPAGVRGRERGEREQEQGGYSSHGRPSSVCSWPHRNATLRGRPARASSRGPKLRMSLSRSAAQGKKGASGSVSVSMDERTATAK